MKKENWEEKAERVFTTIVNNFPKKYKSSTSALSLQPGILDFYDGVYLLAKSNKRVYDILSPKFRNTLQTGFFNNLKKEGVTYCENCGKDFSEDIRQLSFAHIKGYETIEYLPKIAEDSVIQEFEDGLKKYDLKKIAKKFFEEHTIEIVMALCKYGKDNEKYNGQGLSCHARHHAAIKNQSADEFQKRIFRKRTYI